MNVANKKYAKFFLETNRYGGGRKISIIDPRYFNEFLAEVAADLEICDELKMFVFLSLSGALRVSEVTSIQACHIQKTSEGDLVVETKVLKKKKPTKRKLMIHPACAPYVETILLNKRHYEFLLSERLPGGEIRKFTRHDIRYRLDKAFGVDALCPHALRHSMISWLVSLGKKDIFISSLLELSPVVLRRYSHVNAVYEYKKIYGNAG